MDNTINSNDKVWDYVVDFHTSNNNYRIETKTGKTYKNRKDLRKFVKDNRADVTNTLASDNVELSRVCSSSDLQSYTDCTLCKTKIERKTYTISTAIQNHIDDHSGPACSTKLRPCPVCFNFIRTEKIEEHLQCHTELDIDASSSSSSYSRVIDFTNATLELQKSFERIMSSKKRPKAPQIVANRYISTESLFVGVNCIMTPVSHHSLLVDTLKEDPSDVSPVFRFMVKKMKNKPTIYYWSCCLCDDSNSPVVHDFCNDISMRMFATYHLKETHSDKVDVMQVVHRECEILQREVGDDVCLFYESERKRLSCRLRSCFFFVEIPNEDNTKLLSMMMDRSEKDFTKHGAVLCLVCFSPVHSDRVFKHVSAKHKFLQSHLSKSEFQLVPEIAVDAALTADNFPSVTLRYSPMYRIVDTEGSSTETVLMHKWRCLLPSCKQGHTDDVLEFTTIPLLRMYALRHFDLFHSGVFNEKFLKMEWDLLRDDCQMNFNFRTFDQAIDGFGVSKNIGSDPNDYIFPLQSQLLPDNVWKLQFRVCGFCYWSGSTFQFMDHIVSHGFVRSWESLATNEGIHSAVQESGFVVKKINYVSKNVEVSLAPRQLLASDGKKMLAMLRDGLPLHDLTGRTSAAIAAPRSQSVAAIATLLAIEAPPIPAVEPADSGEPKPDVAVAVELDGVPIASNLRTVLESAPDPAPLPLTLLDALQQQQSDSCLENDCGNQEPQRQTAINASNDQEAQQLPTEADDGALADFVEAEMGEMILNDEMPMEGADDSQLATVAIQDNNEVGDVVMSTTAVDCSSVANTDDGEEPEEDLDISGPIDLDLVTSAMNAAMTASRDANVTQRKPRQIQAGTDLLCASAAGGTDTPNVDGQDAQPSDLMAVTDTVDEVAQTEKLAGSCDILDAASDETVDGQSAPKEEKAAAAQETTLALCENADKSYHVLEIPRNKSTTSATPFAMVYNPYADTSMAVEDRDGPCSTGSGRTPRKSAETAMRRISMAKSLKKAIAGEVECVGVSSSSSEMDSSEDDEGDMDQIIGDSTDDSSTGVRDDDEALLESRLLELDGPKPRPPDPTSNSFADFLMQTQDNNMPDDLAAAAALFSETSPDVDIAATQTESMGCNDEPLAAGGVVCSAADTASSVATPVGTDRQHAVVGRGTDAAQDKKFMLERRLQKAFADDIATWKRAPVLTPSQLEIIEGLVKQRCSICAKKIRTAINVSTEDTLLTHFILRHSADDDIRAVLDMKKWKLGTDHASTPTMFLLEPKEGKLCCSSCRVMSYPRFSELRTHYLKCLSANGELNGMVMGKPRLLAVTAWKDPKSQRSLTRGSSEDRVSCSISCGSVWKKSSKYPAALGQLGHLLSMHLHDKLAYEKAMELSKTELHPDLYPHVDVVASFQLSVSKRRQSGLDSGMMLKCSQCPHTSQMTHEHNAHSIRMHTEDKWKFTVKSCPFGCAHIKRRHMMDDAITRVFHVLVKHLDVPGAVEWLLDDKNSVSELMSKQPVYKFDLLLSIGASRRMESPTIVCVSCRKALRPELFCEHRKSGSCDQSSYVSLATAKLLKEKNEQMRSLKDIFKKEVDDTSSTSTRSRSQSQQAIGDKCSYCHSKVRRKPEYTAAVSLLLHKLRKHSAVPNVMEELKQLNEAEFANTYPHIDLIPSIEATVTAVENLRVVCALCGWDSYCPTRLRSHLSTHSGILEDCGLIADGCRLCSFPVRQSLSANDEFQCLAHLLEFHRSRTDDIQSAVEKYSACSPDDQPPFLAAAESARRTTAAASSASSSSEFCCSRCPSVLRSGLAFLHHSQIHTPREKLVAPLQVRSKSLGGFALPALPHSSPAAFDSVVCNICNKSHTISKTLSRRVSIVAHCVRVHCHEDAVEERLTSSVGDISLISSDFPFMDVPKSLETARFQCSLCSSSLSGLGELQKHARTTHVDECINAAKARHISKKAARPTGLELRTENKTNRGATAGDLQSTRRLQSSTVLDTSNITLPSDDGLSLNNMSETSSAKERLLEKYRQRRRSSVGSSLDNVSQSVADKNVIRDSTEDGDFDNSIWRTESMAEIIAMSVNDNETTRPERGSQKQRRRTLDVGQKEKDDADVMFVPVKKEGSVFSMPRRASRDTATPTPSNNTSRRGSGTLTKSPPVMEAADLSSDDVDSLSPVPQTSAAAAAAESSKKSNLRFLAKATRSRASSSAVRSPNDTPKSPKAPRMPAKLSIAQMMSAEWCDAFNKFGDVESQMRAQREASEEADKRAKGKQLLLTSYMTTRKRGDMKVASDATPTTTPSATTRQKRKRVAESVERAEESETVDKVEEVATAAKKARTDDPFVFQSDDDSIPPPYSLLRPRDTSTPIPTLGKNVSCTTPSRSRISEWLSEVDAPANSTVRPSHPSDLLVMQDNLPKNNTVATSLKGALDQILEPPKIYSPSQPRDSAVRSSLASELPRMQVQRAIGGGAGGTTAQQTSEAGPPDVSHIDGVSGFKYA